MDLNQHNADHAQYIVPKAVFEEDITRFATRASLYDLLKNKDALKQTFSKTISQLKEKMGRIIQDKIEETLNDSFNNLQRLFEEKLEMLEGQSLIPDKQVDVVEHFKTLFLSSLSVEEQTDRLVNSWGYAKSSLELSEPEFEWISQAISVSPGNLQSNKIEALMRPSLENLKQALATELNSTFKIKSRDSPMESCTSGPSKVSISSIMDNFGSKDSQRLTRQVADEHEKLIASLKGLVVKMSAKDSDLKSQMAKYSVAAALVELTISDTTTASTQEQLANAAAKHYARLFSLHVADRLCGTAQLHAALTSMDGQKSYALRAIQVANSLRSTVISN